VHYIACAKIERLSVDCNCSVSADVENSNLPPLRKEFRAQLLRSFQLERSFRRHRAPNHRAIEIDYTQRNPAVDEHISEQKIGSELVSRERLRLGTCWGMW